jgi:hypothetical protein
MSRDAWRSFCLWRHLLNLIAAKECESAYTLLFARGPHS